MCSVEAIGFVNGTVRLVDSLSLEDCTAQPFNNTNREAITHIAFSQNCEYFATAVRLDGVFYLCGLCRGKEEGRKGREAMIGDRKTD